MHNRCLYILIILLLSLGLIGCNYNNDDLLNKIEAIKNKPKTDIIPIPDVTTYMPFKYPEHNRDPFDDSIITAKLMPKNKPSGTIKIDTHRSKEYLEGFPLDSLKMVGTLNQGGHNWGLLKTPDGTIQRIKPGNHLGQNHGKITDISSSKIKLIEIIPDGYGGYIKRDASIALESQQ